MGNESQVLEIVECIRQSLPEGGTVCLTGLGVAGKSNLAKELAKKLTCAGVYPFDRFNYPTEFRRNKIGQDGAEVTGCHPESFDAGKALEVLEAIREKRPAPLYGKSYLTDGVIHFPVAETYNPQKYNIIEGLAALHLGREWYDLVLFMDCSIEVERKRRLYRDSKEKGISVEKITGIFDERRRQYEKYILPFRSAADMRIESLEDYSLRLQAFSKD